MLTKLRAKGRMLIAAAVVMLLAVCLPVAAHASDGTAVNGACPSYQFTALDGTPVTNDSQKGKAALLIFFSVDDPYAGASIQELADCDWVASSGLSVIAAEYTEVSQSVLQSYAEEIGSGAAGITFCSASRTDMWSFLDAAQYQGNSVSVPVSFVIDRSGTIRHYMTGSVDAATYRRIVARYVDEVALPAATHVSVTGTYDHSDAFAVLELVNQQRQANGLNTLTMNTTLLDAAMLRAAETSVYWSHIRPNGTSCSTVVDFGYFGENIAAGQTSPEAVMEAWMNSPGHRANILEPNFDSMGVGAFYQDGMVYWVQLFSRNCSTPEAAQRPNEQGTATFEVLEQYFSPTAAPDGLELERGQSRKLTVYADNTAIGGSSTALDAKCATFASANPAVATVSADGTVTAVGGGSTSITIRFAGSGKSVTVPVTVSAPVLLDTPRITAVTNTANGVQVTWGAVDGAEQYRVYARTAGGSWVNVGTTTGTSFVYKNAVSGKSYAFTVRCLNAAGNAFTSSFDPVGKSITYVAQPKITALTNTADGVQITWGKVNGAGMYRVYARTVGGTWKNIGTTADTSFTYKQAASGTLYAFTVRCMNANQTAFTSSYDTVGKGITYVAQPKITTLTSTANGVQVTWDKVAGAGMYRVYARTVGGSWVNVGTTADTSFTYKNAKSGTLYAFTVRCMNANQTAFTSSYDTVGKGIVYVAQPKITTLTNTANGIQVNWGKVNGAAQYRVYAKTAGGSWVNVGTTTGTSFVYQNAVNGRSYTFTVRCLNAAGNVFTSSFDPVGKTITCQR